jgi:hypothetical protein
VTGEDKDPLEDATKRAAALAALVPEALREAAFNKAFDALTGSAGRLKGNFERSRRPNA